MEEVLDPRLKGKPIGIRQKYLLVTCNYTARRMGARKMESVLEARNVWLVCLTVGNVMSTIDVLKNLSRYRINGTALATCLFILRCNGSTGQVADL